MQDNEWQDLDFSEFEDQEEFEKKKNKKQNKQRWREIEAFKDRQRVRKEIDFIDNYNSF